MLRCRGTNTYIGGQPSDSGVIEGPNNATYQVKEVKFRDRIDVLHYIEADDTLKVLHYTMSLLQIMR